MVKAVGYRSYSYQKDGQTKSGGNLQVVMPMVLGENECGSGCEVSSIFIRGGSELHTRLSTMDFSQPKVCTLVYMPFRDRPRLTDVQFVK